MQIKSVEGEQCVVISLLARNIGIDHLYKIEICKPESPFGYGLLGFSSRSCHCDQEASPICQNDHRK